MAAAIAQRLLVMLSTISVFTAAASPSHVLHIVSDVSRMKLPSSVPAYLFQPLPRVLLLHDILSHYRALGRFGMKDLGYNDLGIRNSGKTITPHIDDLIRTGVTLSSYCALF